MYETFRNTADTNMRRQIEPHNVISHSQSLVQGAYVISVNDPCWPRQPVCKLGTPKGAITRFPSRIPVKLIDRYDRHTKSRAHASRKRAFA
ncbi:hypothetical protein KGY14_05500 [Ameyamaea chiangmaiensis]|uniref:Uncharacterized protein n=1 Tax=Ameyamaea chiangmaiensis TaxID=442969 RepID=A0A850PBG9_9PROT|nr:hypothetical protein [Ameyamaea chiangmaiensis]MBS4074645.1 hypothetical protein [Ameyamaea chiangmaiensis]NVN41867.1 hypothetical protein [Ameyamaea chiangmaiensis]